ncbi:MAG TPA: type II toxin-antitoxin system HipA family toxin [Longimicrobium sp.]|nr:type II toxin-antitoxin system HipA family toxin [Longimicrobium sp.]
MTRSIQVYLGDAERLVGTLRYNHEGSRESASFEYDGAWVGAPDASEIEPALRLVAGPQFHRKAPNGSVFHGSIADTEPDGWARRVIMRDHAKRRAEARRAGEDRAPLLGALDFLLEVDDVSRVGALRFRDEDGVFRRTSEQGRRGVPPLVELRHLLAASRAVESNSETAADLACLRGRGTSLGGLRPKCTVIDDAGQLSIGKFPSIGDERAVTKGEVLALRLAAEAGINAADAQLVFSDGTPVTLVRRFDRKAGGRIPYISAATMLGVAPGDPSDHSYAEIVDALREHGADPRTDIEELWRRIAFSILISNVDDHLHNHGFLHVERSFWRLAPAFDVNPFPDRERELKTWITEDTGPQASVEALMAAAPYFQLIPDRAREILAEVESAVRRWRHVGQGMGLTPIELDQFADAFEHAERAVAQRLAASR